MKRIGDDSMELTNECLPTASLVWGLHHPGQCNDLGCNMYTETTEFAKPAIPEIVLDGRALASVVELIHSRPGFYFHFSYHHYLGTSCLHSTFFLLLFVSR